MFYLEERLAQGEVVLLDGATGTELERRGAAMSDDAWCAMATLTHGDLLRDIHEDYIRLGSDVIIANTFATSRAMLAPAGYGDRVGEMVARSVEIAKDARDRASGGRDVAIAGSISQMMPMTIGTGSRDKDRILALDAASASFRELAACLAEAGVDFIMMETLYEPDLATLAVAAAVETGLPVWVGFSARRKTGGQITGFISDDIKFGEIVRNTLPAGGTVAGVMHTNVSIMPDALDALRAHWSGPLMAYPDTGYFEMPNWQFVDVIEPDAFATHCLELVAGGVQVIGGCCGIGIEHMCTLAQGLGRLD